MDAETAYSIAFMIFGLAFFMFVIRMVMRDHREAYERRLMEAREFGYGGKNQQSAKTLHKS